MIDTKLAQPGSPSVRYELVSYRGEIFGPYASIAAAAAAAKEKWPDQEQDEDRSGLGWDIQIQSLKHMIDPTKYDVLVACEESGMVRDALTAVGVRAMSCDLKPTRRPGPHYHGPVEDVLPLRHWRGAIAHPVCKYLANSGSKHLYRRIDGRWAKEHGPDPERWALMEAGAKFFNLFRDARHIPLRAIENSIMHGHAIKLVGRTADQYTQPWMFGDGFTKAAGWWLYGLPKLRRTHQRSDYTEIVAKCWKMGPSEDREQMRSETEPGVAREIARQWGPYFLAPTPLELAMPFMSWAAKLEAAE